jgi:uncharacterized protein YlxW (UPF0749 family)
MKLNLLVLLSIATVCFAQNDPQVATLQETLVKYKAESAEYTDRINKLVVELKKSDANIESSISKALEFTQRYTDSAETGERIMKNEETILRDLIGSVELYSELKKDIVREITMDRNYVKEDMIKIRDWADEKIKLRIKQITAVTTALGGYDIYSSGVSHGDDGADFHGKRRLAEAAVENKMDIVRKMKQGIKSLSERSNELEKELATVRAKRPLEDINNELNAVNEKIAVLEDSIEDILNAEAYGERVGKTASREIEKEMRERVGKIKSSSTSFFKSFDAMMNMLRKQKSLNISIEKYEFAIEQLKADS